MAGIGSEIQGVCFMIENRLFNEIVTIRKPVQVFSQDKMPVIEYQTISVDVKARFEPLNVSNNRNVLGSVPKQIFRVFINSTDVKPNYEVIRQKDNAKFLVTEVKNFFEHHTELTLEEKKCSE